MKNVKLLLIALTAVVLAACQKDASVGLIPADALLVGQANVQDILQKSDLLNSKLIKELKSSIKEYNSSSLAKIYSKCFDDPSETGLDISQPLYMFVTGQAEYMGFVASVESEGKLKELITAMRKADDSAGEYIGKVREGEGFSYVLFDEEDEYRDGILAFSNKAALLLAPMNKRAGKHIDDYAEELFAQKGSDSFFGTDNYKSLSSQDGDVKFVLSAESLPTQALPSQLRRQLNKMLPDDASLNDFRMIASLAFEKGELLAALRVYSDNKSLQKQIESGFEQAGLQSIDGLYTSLFDDQDSYGWASLNINGEKLMEGLQEIGLKSEVDSETWSFLKRYLANIDGDVSVALDAHTTEMPSVKFKAHVNDSFSFRKQDLTMLFGEDNVDTDGDGQYTLYETSGSWDWVYDEYTGSYDYVQTSKTRKPIVSLGKVGDDVYAGNVISSYRGMNGSSSKKLRAFETQIHKSVAFGLFNASSIIGLLVDVQESEKSYCESRVRLASSSDYYDYYDTPEYWQERLDECVNRIAFIESLKDLLSSATLSVSPDGQVEGRLRFVKESENAGKQIVDFVDKTLKTYGTSLFD
ncbi:MAG: DUF4836 family protein [Paludibacteraceae bacterium]|nr:DUF4836 family protein [Paludibacteraceae bacterium]